MRIPWPGIDSGYPDPEGYIDLDVYEAARALSKAAESLALIMLRDEAAGQALLSKAAAQVTRSRAKGGEPIRNLKSYLFRTYKHLLSNELGRLKPSEVYDDGALDDLVAAFGGDAVFEEDFAKSVERRMLVEELRSRMDERTRKVFDNLVIGYNFKEIGQWSGVSARVIRRRYRRQLERIARELRVVKTAENGGSPNDTCDRTFNG